MSYDIYIGNAETEDDLSVIVRRTTHPDAPLMPDSGGQGNDRHPSYSGWGSFVREVGLVGVFFDTKDGLMRSHPGTQVLTERHLRVFERADRAYRAAHPDDRAALCECSRCAPPFLSTSFSPPAHDPRANFNLMRLSWLLFWTRWALDNCERPAIYNH